MTPFGKKLRDLRAQKGVTQKQMAHDLGLSAAYLSALEHGNRGRPTSGLIEQICGYFILDWDGADDLRARAELSHPRVVVDTAGLSPKATELANLLSGAIHALDDDDIDWIIHEIESKVAMKKRTR